MSVDLMAAASRTVINTSCMALESSLRAASSRAIARCSRLYAVAKSFHAVDAGSAKNRIYWWDYYSGYICYEKGINDTTSSHRLNLLLDVRKCER